MKIAKRLIVLTFILTLVVSALGCYRIDGQKMKNVVGTYKLTSYIYTPKYERKEGYTPRTFNYIEDEDYLYEDYLIITGNGMGYYVHKGVNEQAYVKEVTLSYEYSSEDSSIVEYVGFNDALTVNSTSGFNRMGVIKNGLNYTLGSFDYTELFTKRPMRSEYLSVSWEKVSSKTDLSFVKEKIENLKEYSYSAFGARGIYQLNAPWDIETGVVQDTPYQYFYYLIDTAENQTTATAYYALKETPTEQVVQTVSLERVAEDWSSFKLDGNTWTKEQYSVSNYYNETDGLKYNLSRSSTDLSSKTLESLISIWLPLA